ncbi:MAG: hypothetical protein M3Y86_12950 [Verrucomicrobiota bacterium]|nr:hypothetical protein [Verrucomicrobiota bacterium]
MKRILIAGLLGSIAMFIWTSIAHMFLPLGEAGVGELPNESAVLSALQTNIGPHHGLYIFPGTGLGDNATKQERDEAMRHIGDRTASGPSGILMYFPPGRPLSMGRLLGVEFATELAESILVVWLLAQTVIATFGGRLFFVTVAGVLVAIGTNISYWNWYGFPTRYTAAYMLIQVVGFFLIGLVAAFIFGRMRNDSLGA